MCLAEFIAGTVGSAYLGEFLKKAGISAYGAQSSLADNVETGTDWVGKAGDGSREEDEYYRKKHHVILLLFLFLERNGSARGKLGM